MQKYLDSFNKLMSVKNTPSQYEKELFIKAQKYSKYIGWIPGLKMFAVCNSLSMYATKEEGSDIDIFIITAPKRMWIVRLFITVIFQLLGVRRHGNKIKERFCLSFFCTENALNFSSFAIKNDIYLYYWIYYLKPIINKDLCYEKFIKANKSIGINELNLHRDNKLYITKTSKYKKFIDSWKITDIEDLLIKKILLPKALRHKKRLGEPFGVIISDDILKFHDNDRRKEVRDKLIG